MARDAEVSAARLELALAREADDLSELGTAREVARDWPEMTTGERRALIAQVIDCVFVGPGRLPVEYRVTVCPSGTAPTDLPQSGDKRSHSKPFRPRRGHAGPLRVGTGGAHRWTNARLERELASFLEGRSCWPIDEVFAAAERSDLLQQARLRARDQWWAFHFRLPLQNPSVRPTDWSDARIKAELIAYMEGRSEWPTVEQFRADGRGPLRRVIRQRGGLERWAAEVPDAPRLRRRRWTDERIREEIVAICAGRSSFPTESELKRAGQEGLYRALTHRGLDSWAAELGLPRRYSRRAGTAS